MLQVGLVGVLAGALLSAAPAQAAPTRVLQAVSVQIGTDGSVTGLTSRLLGRDDAGDASESSADLDPTLAGQLPVRVTTAWRLGDRTGSDLADLAGESGRVVIDLTVQNTTATAEELEYDVDGTRRSQQALVGVPMTVFAAATVPDTSPEHVVTVDDVTPADVTNGALSTAADGASRVQWSGMLAPPRLSATRTFRLVIDTDDFQPPTFDLTVQPGLITDGSAAALADAAFSTDRDSLLALENRTVELFGNVNSVLAEATVVLADLQTQLRDNAGRLGNQTISDLQTSNAHLVSSLQGLVGDLGSLQGEMSSELTDNASEIASSLGATLTSVEKLIGDPERMKEPRVPSGDGCGDFELGSKAKRTVFGQVLLVKAQLDALAGTTGACAAEISQSLLANLGTVDPEHPDADPCVAQPGSAICVLAGARTSLTEEASTFQDLRSQLDSGLGTTQVSELGASVKLVVADVAAIDEALAGLKTGNLQQLDHKLDDLRGHLVSLQSDASVISVGGVASDLDTLGATAAARLAALGATDRPDTALGKASSTSALVAQLCDVPVVADPSSLPQNVADYLDGATTSCADAAARAADVVTALQNEVAAWQQAATIAQDRGDLDDVQDAVDALAQQAQDAVGALDAARGSDLRDVVSLVGSVVDLLGADFQGDLGVDPSTCPAGGVPPVADDAPVVSRVIAATADLQCTYASIDGTLDDGFAAMADSVARSTGSIGESITDTDVARQDADDAVTGLSSLFADTATAAGADVKKRVGHKVTRQRTALENRVGDAVVDTQRTTDAALGRIGTAVDSANASLLASEKALSADLQQVLVDLGENEDGGTGLLGSIQTGATLTGVSQDKILQAARQADAYANIRGRDLAELYLQQAQTAASLDRLAAFPAFGVELPDGTQHLTVFTFHLGG